MTNTSQLFGETKFLTIKGRRMAYLDEGDGPAIVFLHGCPTSSYLGRNVMPTCRGLGRLVACDMIGMGESEKLRDSGPGQYMNTEYREYMFGRWEQLELGDEIVFVVHDWGSVLAFDWAGRNRTRVQGLAYMEAILRENKWDDFPEAPREAIRALRSPAGDDMILRDNYFVEKMLPGMVMRKLTDDELNHYRKPYLRPGEDRRPLLTMTHQIPIEGEPADVVQVIKDFTLWLASSAVPKLYLHTDPGILDSGKQRALCQTWSNQKEVTVKGLHLAQEDSWSEIGAAVADFVRTLRAKWTLESGR
ncbi:MAG: haloalkane dehalogenase [Bradyrhizobium sp.]|nr:haloalkane dehalogenase [Bradyrhizobium sp.]